MKERFIRKLAYAPWHAWIKDSPDWMDLLAEIWARLPEAALRKICLGAPKLVILPPVYGGRIVRLDAPLWRGAYIMQLDPNLLERPRDHAIGILAHEFAHLCVEATADELTNDLAADRLAIKWGFHSELRDALRNDLGESHPRVVQAAA